MKKFFIIKAGTTFQETISQYGDFDQWIMNGLKGVSSKIKVVDIQSHEPLPQLHECAGVIISGSHSMVTEQEPWSIKLQEWIVELFNESIPMLGICYGHQLIAQSLGGVCGYHPNGMEIGTVEIELNNEGINDILFLGCKQRFLAHTVHSQTVLKLPTDAINLAYNQHDAHHAFKVGEWCWGVQFHPEYTTEIMASYIQEVSKEKKLASEVLLQNVQKTPYANTLLEQFGKIVEKRL
ncbi:MAG: glutamine amidotransferase [Candidatus Marinarcus sp.]|uniref:glutamine amidotransferase n=1 Tax=Candidatus Marinarcus sp. TaxID=3100987 RepID=UPI003B004C7C